GDDAGRGAGGGHVEPGDAGARYVAAHEVGVEHAGQAHVVDVAPAAGQQARVLLAGYGLADEPPRCRGVDGGHPAPPAPPAPPLAATPTPAPPSAAIFTAAMIPWYPVQRHRLPDRPSRISWSLGLGWSRKNAVTDTMNPGVQNPHCSPWHCRNASWIGLSDPSAGDRPSIVVTSDPTAWTANIRHDRTASPSSSTVHAPHTPCSHPRCVPVSSQSSRSVSASVLRGSMSTTRRRPLTVSVTGISSMAGLLEGLGEGTGHQVRTDLVTVRRRTVQVVGRVGPAHCELADLGEVRAGDRRAGEGRFGIGGAQRRR